MMSSSFAQDVRVEAAAIISEGVERQQINDTANRIQAHGHKCDSISAVVPFALGTGYNVSCNDFTYNYDVVDKEGTWTVNID